MSTKLRTALLVVAVVTLVAGVSWGQAPRSKKDDPTRSTRLAGDSAVYVPMIPCRVVDTRFGGGRLAPGEQRSYQVYGNGNVFAQQGGKPNGCGISNLSIAVEASVTAIGPTANGWLRAWPTNQVEPTATFLNFTKGQNITNTGALTISDFEVKDLTIRNYGSSTHYVIDIQGYYHNVGPPPAP